MLTVVTFSGLYWRRLWDWVHWGVSSNGGCAYAARRQLGAACWNPTGRLRRCGIPVRKSWSSMARLPGNPDGRYADRLFPRVHGYRDLTCVTPLDDLRVGDTQTVWRLDRLGCLFHAKLPPHGAERRGVSGPHDSIGILLWRTPGKAYETWREAG